MAGALGRFARRWVAILALCAVPAAACALVLTFAWTAGPNPAGTTHELEANGITAAGLSGTQHALDVPLGPGRRVDARVRAVAPPGYECGDPLGPCPPSDWITLSQLLPDVQPPPSRAAVLFGGAPMPLSLTALTSGSSTSNPSTTATISPTAGRKWLAVVAVSVAGGGVTSVSDTIGVTGAGLTWIQVAQISTWGSRRGLYVFRGDGTPSSGVLTLTYTPGSGGSFEQQKWAIVEISGGDTTTPYGTAYTNLGSGTDASVTVSDAPDAGDFVFFAHAQEDNNTDTLGAELDTSLVRVGDATGARRLGVSYDSAPDSTPAPGVTWTGAASWGAIGFVLNVGAGAAATSLPPASRSPFLAHMLVR